MAAVPGLGPKRMKLLYDRLHIRTLDKLRRAARSGRIREIKGFSAPAEAAETGKTC
jgi:DNA polymerase (family 10)